METVYEMLNSVLSEEQGIGRSQFGIFGIPSHKRVNWTLKYHLNVIGCSDWLKKSGEMTELKVFTIDNTQYSCTQLNSFSHRIPLGTFSILLCYGHVYDKVSKVQKDINSSEYIVFMLF